MTIKFTDRVVVNRFSAMMVLAAGILIFSVPQVTALLLLRPQSLFEYGLGVAVMGLIVIYALLWFSAVPIDELSEEHRFGPGLSLHGWLSSHLGHYIDKSLRWLSEHKYVALVLLGTSGLMVWFEWVAPFAINLGVLSAWLLMQQWSKLILLSFLLETPKDKVGVATKLVGRTITLLLLTSAAGELLWTLVGSLHDAGAYRAYSAWAVVQTLFACLLTVRAFDGLAMLGLPWIRTKAFIAFIAFGLITPGGETIGALKTERPLSAHAGLPAMMQLTATPPGVQSDWLDDLQGRLREVPQDEPVLFVAASGGGSRAAIVASLTYEALASIKTKRHSTRTLADNVVLISSVSGGSLATAYFASGGVAASRQLLDRDWQPGLFAQEMSTDFMAPLLRGVLTASIERGTSVSEFWRDRYKWEKLTDDAARAPGRPLVIFNATSVQTGARVGIGFPALPAAMLKPALVVADIAPNLQLSLADAVRLSANFPYGFEYAVLAADGSNTHFADRQLIDGGIIDNTGLDTISYLMDGLQRSASLTVDKPEDRQRAEAGRRVLEELRLRGILLIEIDAGARPASPSRFAQHFPSINKPIEALGQAGHLNAAVARTRNLDLILRSLETDDEVPAVVGIARVGFDCDPQGDVMTAWALDEAQLTQIHGKFDSLLPRVNDIVTTQFETIGMLQLARRQSLRDSDDLVVKDAATLRATYEAYLEVARTSDANHHLNARTCRAGVSSEQTQALSALKNTVEKTRASVRPIIAKADSLPVAAIIAQRTSPNGSLVDVTEPADEPQSSGLGWLYLGEFTENAWKTRYTSWNEPRLPPLKTKLQLLTASNIRSARPDQFGRLASVRISLPTRTQLEVLEVVGWQDSGLIWARIRRPHEPTKQ